jgi:hypothetical protein
MSQFFQSVNTSTLPSNVPLVFKGDTGAGATAVANLININGSGAIVNTTGNEITISVPTPPRIVQWALATVSQQLLVNFGYICVSGGALTLLLPATSTLGDIIEITLDGASSFSVTQGAGQSIRIGNVSTTVGVGGSLISTQQGDSLRMVCQTANLKWNVLSAMGNPLVA